MSATIAYGNPVKGRQDSLIVEPGHPLSCSAARLLLRSLALLPLPERLNRDVPIRDRSVIALEHQWADCFFIQLIGGAGGTGHFDIFLNDFPVMHDFDEP